MIIVATTKGEIRLTDRASTNWHASARLVGSSILGIVAPTERLAALRFIERLTADPGVPMSDHFDLVQPGGKERAHTVLAACVDDALVVQFRPRSHAAERLDESLLWIAMDAPGIDHVVRPKLVASVARAVWRALPDACVVHEHAIVSVSLPAGSRVEDLEEIHRQILADSSSVAGLGKRFAGVAGHVRGVHFGDMEMTGLAPTAPAPTAPMVR